MKAQGLDLISGNSRGMTAPAGTPPEILKILDDTVKKVVDSAEFKEGHGEVEAADTPYEPS